MTEDQAFRCLAPLVALGSVWDDPKVELWIHKLSGLADQQWAAEAIDLVIDTHTAPGTPPWAKVLETYQAISRRNVGSQHSLPSAEQCMTLDDYLAKLKLNAAGGSSEARGELDRWERLATKKRKDGSTPDWIAALQ